MFQQIEQRVRPLRGVECGQLFDVHPSMNAEAAGSSAPVALAALCTRSISLLIQGKGDELKALLRGLTADACRGRLLVSNIMSV